MTRIDTVQSKPTITDSVIIGAGVSGVALGATLSKKGQEFIILEANESLGGVWQSNTYPGVACDVASHLYQYSFALTESFNRIFPSGLELKNYFSSVVEEFGFRDRIHLHERLEKADWDDGFWHLQTHKKWNIKCRNLILATGTLRTPNTPQFPGHESFIGPQIHTARWNHNIDYKGKKVALIGTGSSALQVFTSIVDDVAELKIFQRSAPWVLPVKNHKYPLFLNFLFTKSKRFRKLFFDLSSYLITRSYGEIYLRRSPVTKTLLTWLCRAYLRSIKDKNLRRLITPNYEFGCKRITYSPEYYTKIQRSNIQIITASISNVTKSGIRTDDKIHHDVDIIIYATGFKASTYHRPIRVTNKQKNSSLAEQWKTSLLNYRSIHVPEMPNLFLMLGPNSPIANVSNTLIAEWQSKYIANCIEEVLTRGIAMTPRRSAIEAQQKDLQTASQNTTWLSGGCDNSWFLYGNNQTLLYPHPPLKYRDEIKSILWSDFEIMELDLN